MTQDWATDQTATVNEHNDRRGLSRDCPAFERGGQMPALAERIEGFFVRYRRHVTLINLALFGLFVALMLLPLFLDEPAEDATPLSHFTTFSNYVIWAVWFPLILLSVILTGRSWCGLLCPIGAASEWSNKIGTKLQIPRWVRWRGTPLISFFVVTIWGQTVGVRDHPEATAIVFGTVLIVAILLGILFGKNKRAWCRHMCPIGLLLGVYSRIGAVDFRPKRPRLGGDQWTERTACPTMIEIDRKTESRHCIECFRCVSPKAKGGLYLRFRWPGEEIEAIRDHNPNLSELVFFFASTGIVLGAFMWLALDSYQQIRSAIGTWVIDQEWYWLGEPGPFWLMSVHPERREVFYWFDFFMISGYMLAWLAVMTAVLGATTALAAWLSGRLGGDGSFRTRFLELAYQYAPVAMISLLLGLGGELFRNLEILGFGADGIAIVKAVLFIGAWLWSVRLGERLLARQQVPWQRRWLPLLAGGGGGLAICAAWYPAIFGV